jgi:hypothetical protein
MYGVFPFDTATGDEFNRDFKGHTAAFRGTGSMSSYEMQLAIAMVRHA